MSVSFDSGTGSTARRMPPEMSSLDRSPEFRTMEYWGVTDRGGRDMNEDQFLVATISNPVTVPVSSVRDLVTHSRAELNESPHLLAVADGLGGHAGGEVASALAMRTLIASLCQQSRHDRWLSNLEQATREADARILAYGREHPEVHGLGTTLTAALIVQGNLLLAHAGDSRAYLHRGGELRRLTSDHTFAEKMREHARRNGTKVIPMGHLEHVLLNSVGGVDEGVDIETHVRRLDRADVLLLCSDGLTRAVSEREIAERISREGPCREIASSLLDHALRSGATDNVTIVVARFV